MTNAIKEYWDQRAAENVAAPTATTNDVHLRQLELRTFIDKLRSLSMPDDAVLLDVGCGDGATTLGIAREFPGLRVVGIDYSENMIHLAKRRLVEEEPPVRHRVEFRCGDARCLGETLGDSQFDVVVSDRCLINLETAQQQDEALEQIACRVRPGGYYLGIENFIEGQENMNAARAALGLAPIPVRWHNLFFREDELRSRISAWFDSVQLEDFSSAYYFATRVIYSELCRMRGEQPDYDHEIHQLATRLPAFGQYSPIRLIVAKRGVEPAPTASPAERQFQAEKAERIRDLAEQTALRAMSVGWLCEVSKHKYCYNFSWLGRPIIQFPQDIVAIQELIWRIRPDAVVETGVAHGGSLILSASCLELLGGDGRVLGIDIDIRPHNRRAIEAHPLSRHIRLLEGASTDERVFARVERFCRGCRQVLVILDSNHTHDHVRRELELYSRLVRRGGYLVVMDTIIEDMPIDSFPDRPWSRGNNPKTAVWEFLRANRRFEIDRELEAKLQITVAPDGWLRCLADPEDREDLP